jgi:hypothetical protein
MFRSRQARGFRSARPRNALNVEHLESRLTPAAADFTSTTLLTVLPPPAPAASGDETASVELSGQFQVGQETESFDLQKTVDLGHADRRVRLDIDRTIEKESQGVDVEAHIHGKAWLSVKGEGDQRVVEATIEVGSVLETLGSTDQASLSVIGKVDYTRSDGQTTTFELDDPTTLKSLAGEKVAVAAKEKSHLKMKAVEKETEVTAAGKYKMAVAGKKEEIKHSMKVEAVGEMAHMKAAAADHLQGGTDTPAASHKMQLTMDGQLTKLKVAHRAKLKVAKNEWIKYKEALAVEGKVSAFQKSQQVELDPAGAVAGNAEVTLIEGSGVTANLDALLVTDLDGVKKKLPRKQTFSGPFIQIAFNDGLGGNGRPPDGTGAPPVLNQPPGGALT